MNYVFDYSFELDEGFMKVDPLSLRASTRKEIKTSIYPMFKITMNTMLKIKGILVEIAARQPGNLSEAEDYLQKMICNSYKSNNEEFWKSFSSGVYRTPASKCTPAPVDEIGVEEIMSTPKKELVVQQLERKEEPRLGKRTPPQELVLENLHVKEGKSASKEKPRREAQVEQILPSVESQKPEVQELPATPLQPPVQTRWRTVHSQNPAPPPTTPSKDDIAAADRLDGIVLSPKLKENELPAQAESVQAPIGEDSSQFGQKFKTIVPRPVPEPSFLAESAAYLLSNNETSQPASKAIVPRVVRKDEIANPADVDHKVTIRGQLGGPLLKRAVESSFNKRFKSFADSQNVSQVALQKKPPLILPKPETAHDTLQSSKVVSKLTHSNNLRSYPEVYSIRSSQDKATPDEKEVRLAGALSVPMVEEPILPLSQKIFSDPPSDTVTFPALRAASTAMADELHHSSVRNAEDLTSNNSIQVASSVQFPPRPPPPTSPRSPPLELLDPANTSSFLPEQPPVPNSAQPPPLNHLPAQAQIQQRTSPVYGAPRRFIDSLSESSSDLLTNQQSALENTPISPKLLERNLEEFHHQHRQEPKTSPPNELCFKFASISSLADLKVFEDIKQHIPSITAYTSDDRCKVSIVTSNKVLVYDFEANKLLYEFDNQECKFTTFVEEMDIKIGIRCLTNKDASVVVFHTNHRRNMRSFANTWINKIAVWNEYAIVGDQNSIHLFNLPQLRAESERLPGEDVEFELSECSGYYQIALNSHQTDFVVAGDHIYCIDANSSQISKRSLKTLMSKDVLEEIQTWRFEPDSQTDRKDMIVNVKSPHVVVTAGNMVFLLDETDISTTKFKMRVANDIKSQVIQKYEDKHLVYLIDEKNRFMILYTSLDTFELRASTQYEITPTEIVKGLLSVQDEKILVFGKDILSLSTIVQDV